jgi:hypothetical protein
MAEDDRQLGKHFDFDAYLAEHAGDEPSASGLAIAYGDLFPQPSISDLIGDDTISKITSALGPSAAVSEAASSFLEAYGAGLGSDTFADRFPALTAEPFPVDYTIPDIGPITSNADIVDAIHEQHAVLRSLVEEAKLSRKLEQERWAQQQKDRAADERTARRRWRIEVILLLATIVLSLAAVWATAHYAR